MGNPAGVAIRLVVQPIDLIAGKALEQAIFQHGPRSAEPLFSRLENEDRGAIEIAGLCKIARCSEQDGRVSVMAAAVKAARYLRGEWQVRLLIHGQGIHVGPQPYRSAG